MIKDKTGKGEKFVLKMDKTRDEILLLRGIFKRILNVHFKEEHTLNEKGKAEKTALEAHIKELDKWIEINDLIIGGRC
jgi:hypothetical protein